MAAAAKLIASSVQVIALDGMEIVSVLVPGLPVTATPPEPTMLILFPVGPTAPPELPVNVSTTPVPLPAMLMMPACDTRTSRE